jgi:hypothetical protein
MIQAADTRRAKDRTKTVESETDLLAFLQVLPARTDQDDETQDHDNAA